MFRMLGGVNTYAKLFILIELVINLGMNLVVLSENLSSMKRNVLFKKSEPACAITCGQEAIPSTYSPCCYFC